MSQNYEIFVIKKYFVIFFVFFIISQVNTSNQQEMFSLN